MPSVLGAASWRESYSGIKRRDRAKLFSVAAGEWLVQKSLHTYR
jgi:hypothetical protein